MPEARLHVTDSQGRRTVTIDKPIFTIGRRSAADLQVVSTDVSRDHADISHDSDRYVLRDRGSRYGTFVNGEPVTEHTLAHGDRIRLGRSDAVELLFLTDPDDQSGLREATSGIADLRQMAGLLNGLRALGSGRVLEEVLTLVLDSALDVTTADRGFIMLANAEGELEFKTARAKGHVTLSGTTFATSYKIPRDVFLTGQSRMVGDLMDGSLANVHDGTIALGIRHVLCVPLRIVRYIAQPRADDNKVIGVLYLDGREKSTLLSRTTKTSLETFATEAALAIESARLYADSAEKSRLERDLRLAAEIQRALLPEARHEDACFDLAAVAVPCRTIGGDFFDYLDLPDGRFGFVLGDVAGKGPPAALLAVAVQSVFAAQAALAADPGDTMTRINRALMRRAIEARFATMFYGVLSRDGQLSYCNAGHESPVIVGGKRRSKSLDTGGVVLGLFDTARYEFETLQLEPGDTIVVFSDGVSEARNARDDEFGRARLVTALADSQDLSSDAVLERLFASLRDFTAGAPQADDVTVLVLRYRGPGLQSTVTSQRSE